MYCQNIQTTKEIDNYFLARQTNIVFIKDMHSKTIKKKAIMHVKSKKN